ncbi:MAG: hypothetical protein ACERK6_07065 [Candidatus Aminicenantaceae bacterium]
MKRTACKTGQVCVALFVILLAAGTGLLGQQADQDLDLSSVAVIDDSGKFEIGLYYGRWTLNPLISQFEEDLSEELGERIREEINDELMNLNPFLLPTTYVDQFTFDSNGPNYGLELRYYPQGRLGAFSVGLSFDKVTMRIYGEGSTLQNYDDGSYAEAIGTGEVILRPLFTTLSFRWDFVPRWRVTPYFSMAAGLASIGKVKQSGDVVNYDKTDHVSWEYQGKYNWVGPDYSISGGGTLTLKEAEEEGDFNIPNILPLISLNFGARAEITPNLLVRAEIGFWDGLGFRLGISGRF